MTIESRPDETVPEGPCLKVGKMPIANSGLDSMLLKLAGSSINVLTWAAKEPA
jgi:hypothetical protein